MDSLIVLCCIGALVSIYELLHDSDIQRYISSLAIRSAFIVSSLITNWDAKYIALLLFCSPSTIVMLVTEATRVIKGEKREIHFDNKRPKFSTRVDHSKGRRESEQRGLSSDRDSQKQDIS